MKGVVSRSCTICGAAAYDNIGLIVMPPVTNQGWLSRFLDWLLPCHHDWLKVDADLANVGES